MIKNSWFYQKTPKICEVQVLEISSLADSHNCHKSRMILIICIREPASKCCHLLYFVSKIITIDIFTWTRSSAYMTTLWGEPILKNWDPHPSNAGKGQPQS